MQAIEYLVNRFQSESPDPNSCVKIDSVNVSEIFWDLSSPQPVLSERSEPTIVCQPQTKSLYKRGLKRIV